MAGEPRGAIGRLIVFQALAVNAGSTLSPVGNPQNLYLWQAYEVGFGEFLIALRLGRRPRLWGEFHRWSLPMLALSLLLAFALERLMGA